MKQRVPAGAELLFPDIGRAEAYAELLATEGVRRGLIGPREVERLWDRHLVNSALLAGEFAQGASIADVGTGAGLPGMVVALVRPDLQVTLVEPLLRRVTFLSEVVDALELPHVTIVRGRADEVSGRFDAVASRAVARLPQLLRWCVPLARAGGTVVAMKGEAALAELEESRELWHGDVLGQAEVRTVEGPGGFSPVTFVRVPVRKAVKVGWGVAAQRAATKRSGRRR